MELNNLLSYDNQRAHQEVFDLIVDACQSVELVKNQTGDGYTKQLMMDPEKAWWKTHLVNSATFARFAYKIKETERMAQDCYNHMSEARAQVISEQIKQRCLSYRYSIDAKSSESLRDKNNTQPTLIDKMNKSNVPHAVTLKQEAGRSFLSALAGRDKSQEEE